MSVVLVKLAQFVGKCGDVDGFVHKCDTLPQEEASKISSSFWEWMRWDSNPQFPLQDGGFKDRCVYRFHHASVLGTGPDVLRPGLVRVEPVWASFPSKSRDARLIDRLRLSHSAPSTRYTEHSLVFSSENTYPSF